MVILYIRKLGRFLHTSDHYWK